MVLIGVVGLAFVMGMPYLLENSMFPLLPFLPTSPTRSLLPSFLSILSLYLQRHKRADVSPAVDPETRAEFEEQQKKGILGTGAGPSQANALQNFDMASWMAGRQQATSSPGPGQKEKDKDAQGQGSGREGGGGAKKRG